MEAQKRQKERQEKLIINEKDSRRRDLQHSALAKLKALQFESDRDNAKQEAKARAEEEAVLERERESIAEQADRLAWQEGEKQAARQRQVQKNEVTVTANEAEKQ